MNIIKLIVVIALIPAFFHISHGSGSDTKVLTGGKRSGAYVTEYWYITGDPEIGFPTSTPLYEGERMVESYPPQFYHIYYSRWGSTDHAINTWASVQIYYCLAHYFPEPFYTDFAPLSPP